MNIFLVGMMGAGKSSVGSLLASELKYEFVDLDKSIERQLGKSTNAIFKTYGESYFREMEQKKLFEHKNTDKKVVSTGGGVILNQENKEFLSQENTYFLDASATILWERASRKKYNRPLLEGLTFNAFEELYNIRRSLYSSCSKTLVNTENKSIALIVKEIKNYANNNY